MRHKKKFQFILFVGSFLSSFGLPANEAFKEEASLRRMQQISTNFQKASRLFFKLNDLSSKIFKPRVEGETYASRNRTMGFLPYDETRTCREVKNFYISANDITTPQQNYIVAQAPIESTVVDFWQMILFKNCHLIVTACMPIESNRDRCTAYWQQPYLPSEVLGWIINFDGEEVLQNGEKKERIVKRSFTATQLFTHNRRTITQLHLENWVDYSVPSLGLFEHLVNYVDVYAEAKTPILVHCSAGVGRSGTFVAAHSLRQEILAGCTEINIPQRIFDLRLQRAELVTTVKQFQFIYKTLLPLLLT